MKSYQLTGFHSSGEKWDFAPIFKTKERAEQQLLIETNAYKDTGSCSFWTFQITEIDIRE
jgi:hypothetical protein